MNLITLTYYLQNESKYFTIINFFSPHISLSSLSLLFSLISSIKKPIKSAYKIRLNRIIMVNKNQNFTCIQKAKKEIPKMQSKKLIGHFHGPWGPSSLIPQFSLSLSLFSFLSFKIVACLNLSLPRPTVSILTLWTPFVVFLITSFAYTQKTILINHHSKATRFNSI